LYEFGFAEIREASLDFRSDRTGMNSPQPTFRAPTAVERAFNRVFGLVVGMGWGFSYNYLLQVRGRKSGKIYSTPIDLLELNGKRYLVAPRAEPSGCATLKLLERSRSREGS
jgi:hypothetical protein